MTGMGPGVALARRFWRPGNGVYILDVGRSARPETGMGPEVRGLALGRWWGTAVPVMGAGVGRSARPLTICSGVQGGSPGPLV